MTRADYDDFCAVIVGFAELKGRSLSAAAIELYWRSMQQWPIEEFKLAAEQLVRTCEFMPGPNHFEQLRNAGRATPGEAWAEVLAHVRAGKYRGRAVVVSDLIDRAVASIGGYHAIGMSETDKTHFLEKRFNEAFAQLQDAEDVRESVPQIAYSSDLPRLNGPASIRNILGKIGQ